MNGIADNVQPPFLAADDLFDLTNPRTLGLKELPGEHVLLYRATEGGYTFSHHPNLAVFRDQLYCMWSNGKDSEDRPGQRILYARSTDGRVWTEPELLTDQDQGRGTCVAAGFHVAGDTLVALYTVPHYPTHNLFHPDTALFARTSSDGQSWGEARRITSGFFIETPHKLPGGRLLLSGEHVGEDWKANKVRMRMLYSDQPDGLGGWEEAVISPDDTKVFGYTEPSPFVRSDGVIVMPFRNNSGHLYASASRDEGRTWTVPRPTNFPDSRARFCPGVLPDGTVYLINNPGPGLGNRSLLTIALSADGMVFDRAWLLRGDPTEGRFAGEAKAHGWQYPNALVCGDALYVVYSINKEDVGLTRIALEELR